MECGTDMKPTGKHPSNALTAAKVRALKEQGRYADGNGLYLVVDPSGAKRWVLRTVVQEIRRDIGLGGISTVSLAQAREAAAGMRKIAREGGDPIADRRITRQVVPSFEEAAATVHTELSQAWKNEKHAAQWINTLKQYVFPVFGNLPVDRIGSPEVLRALSPIWLAKPETAKRVRQRIGAVLDWAKAAGYRSGDNPIGEISKVLPKQTDMDEHHVAMPYADISRFVQALQAGNSSLSAKLAFEFLILTATRTSEVLEAVWHEVDFESQAWTIPASRMKGNREHRVPLSPRCIDLLTQAKSLSDEVDGYVFLGQAANKPMSNMVFLMALRRMEIKVTAHGFRSSFRDWASEQTNFPSDVCEMALAHSVKNKVEAAYRRGDLFEKRRELMDAWTGYVTTAVANSDTVIVLNSGT